MLHWKKIISLMLLLGVIMGCGGDLIDFGGGGDASITFDPCVVTGLPPVISTITPAAASIAGGTVVTISGYGYCNAAPMNVVTIGTAAVSATSYGLVAAPTATDIESLTFTLPATTPVGVQTVFVTVVGSTSNTNLTLTVTP